MKTLTLILAITVAMLMANLTSASEGDSTHVVTKIVKVIDNGKTIVDTTIVYTDDDMDNFFMDNLTGTNMRMIKHRKVMAPKGHAMMWTNDDDQEYEVTIESDGDSSNVVVMRQPGNKVKEFRFDGAPIKNHKMMIFNDEDFGELPGIKSLKKQHQNLIDLNDPNIISFEKVQTKDGNEKITIVRKKIEE